MASDTSLIITLDRNYLIPALILFKNLINNSKGNYKIEFWFSYSVKKSEVMFFKKITDKLNKTFIVNFHKQEELQAPGYKYLTSGAWIRLCAMDLPRPGANLLIYLDCDLFLKSGWDDFIQTIPREFNSLYARRTSGHRNFELKYPSSNKESYYFNSGVLFFSPNWWFSSGYSSEWRHILVDYDNLGFKTLDQDLLNYMIRNHYSALPLELNSYPSEINFRTKVIHFAGISKPWGFFQIGSKDCDKFQHRLIREVKNSYTKNLNSIFFLIFKFGGILGLELIFKFYLRFTIMNIKNRFNVMKH
jgi:lipopolysaccharide biosynthesis glycosyltransferase